jgi:hypothetical protein
MQYKWKCLFTGNSGISEFTKVQHWIFGETSKDSDRIKLRAAADLINTWNRQQPLSWQYELIDQPAETA